MYTSPEEESASTPGGRLLIVADGMGGHRGGATASRLAAETVKTQYLGAETADIAAALRDSLARANKRIFSEAQSNPDLRGMGTTTSALAIRGGQGWFAHVGDSRIYMVRGEEIRQLTDDHSLVASMVREGLLTMKEAENHPRRNVLQRSMGVAEDVEIDVRGPFQIQEGDVFILCSDGLHGLVKEDELKEIAKLSIDAAADEYLKRALERGAPDNVTVIVARVERAQPGEIGDDTMIEERLDDTQPLTPLDPLLFDETVRDPARKPVDPNATTEPVAAMPAPVPEVVPTTLEVVAPAPASEPVAESEPQPAAAVAPDEEDTVEVLVPPPAKRSSGIVKLILLVALVLGAAGAWFYWNSINQQGITDTSRRSR